MGKRAERSEWPLSFRAEVKARMKGKLPKRARKCRAETALTLASLEGSAFERMVRARWILAKCAKCRACALGRV